MYTGLKNTTSECTKIIPHCHDERYELIATPINSNKFTEFDLTKSKNFDLKT